MADPLLVQFGIAVTAIALIGALASRIRLSVIPAYIVVGILVGPNEPTSIGGISLQLVQTGEFIDLLAELGIVFLLFFLGLEFSLQQLVSNRDRLVKVGLVDLGINFSLGLGLGVVFGFSWLEAFFLAGIVYISSSAVITKSLIDQGWIANAESEPILGTLVFEDIFIAVYLALLSAVALGEGSPTDAALSIGVSVAFLVVLVAVAWYGSEYIERLFETESNELFLLRVTGITVLIAGTALALGVSEAVAAFFVGTMFSQTDHVHRIEQVLSPVRDLFAAIFFFSIGLATDITLLADVLLLLGVAVVVTTVGKFVSGTVSGRFYGLDRTRSFRVGFGMVPRGEFSLVLSTLAISVGTGALGDLIPAFTVGYVLIMSILGTLLIQHADRVTDALETALA
ncbi:potassium/proton antiporter membrane subunit, CPA2 family [Haladaptatus litoreus]|uniref:Potassium/proton antiporter membrane subunit, CPA2 family n=1 Tax=Haladaptatus litoreus TaxID=553468 RepID=A0A1N6US63_9EURY|nr:cation:proton antiporter [Haladaptatus litoreus]SIQ68419.1 potassium/proton antiporter membrane subunit, CPA2 family [Haladaptatus litoreus]